MKKILLTAAAVALLATSAQAKEAGDSFYVKGLLGSSFGNKYQTKTNKPGDNALIAKGKNHKSLVGTVGVGAAFSNGLRSELEFFMDGGYKSASKKTIGANNYKVQTKVKTFATFANAYFDIKNSSAVTPYVMGGLGWAHTKPTVTYTKNNSVTNYKLKAKNTLAYQLGAGVGVKVAKNVTLDAGYRYMDTRVKAKDTKNQVKFKSAGAHMLLAGVRVSF
jgi:opacity protein-like surface antigen